MLFFGQTGLEKKRVEAALTESIEDVSTRASINPAEVWEAFHFENYLLDGRMSVREFMALDPARRHEEWARAFRSLLRDFEASQARHRGVFLHGHYWWQGELFTTLVFAELARLQPTLILTLIDDVYDIHTRVLSRERDEATGASSLLLPQLVTWRWAEIALGDLVARNARPDRTLPHFVFAVKHPAHVLRQLLLERRRLPVYVSFPITKVRRPARAISPDQQEQLRREINEFRRRMRATEYTVLDPLTVDELLFDVAGTLYPRWPLDDLPPMVPAEPELNAMTVRQLADRGILDILRREVNIQISRRDFRMIDAVDAVACYRPKACDGEHSGGTQEELRYAQRSAKPALVVHLASSDGGLYQGEGPFDHVVQPVVYGTTDELLDHLARLQERRNDRFAKDEPQAWV